MALPSRLSNTSEFWYLGELVTTPADIPKDPLSDDYGFDRGTPINRRYIESFLAEHQADIYGSVLEVGDDRYSEAFGQGHITALTVVDLDASNPRATLIADLSATESLSRDSYDCILLVETLHLLLEPQTCLRNCWRAVRPQGTLLVTVPTLKRLSPGHPQNDYWRFTPAGLQALMNRSWPGPFTVCAYGNLRASIAFLLALVVEECGDDDLEVSDPRFPLTAAVHARKP
jgi:SAM-dependent methyltransferase